MIDVMASTYSVSSKGVFFAAFLAAASDIENISVHRIALQLAF